MAKTANARGFGNVRKLPSGNWQVRYTDPQGLTRTARMTFGTKREGELELSRIRQAIETGSWQPDFSPQSGELDPRTMTLSQLAAHWRAQQVTSQGKPLAKSTLAEYERLIERTLSGFKDKPIRSITTQQLEKWRARELEREVLNQTSKAYKHLKTLMTFAHKRKWITANPCTIERATSYKPSEPPAPSREQVLIMQENAPSPFDLILAIASQGGLRKGELLELRRKDIVYTEIDGNTWAEIHVSRAVTWDKGIASVKAPKTAQSVRKVLLPFEIAERLQEHMRGLNISPEALLFHKGADAFAHWSEWQVRPYWDKVSELAGFKGRFHSLRTYHLTQFGIAGATTKEIMDRGGHSNIQTAMRYQRSTGREAELLKRLG